MLSLPEPTAAAFRNRIECLNVPPLPLGVLRDPADRRPHGQRFAPHRRPRPPDGVRPHGRSRCLSDSGAGQTSGIQLVEEGQMELHVHASGAAQPEPGPLCLHLQRVQAPRGDTLPLHRL